MKVVESFNLKDYNNFKVSAICKRAFFPENENDFLNIYNQFDRQSIILLGGGYNVVLSRPYYNENFIILNGNFSSVNVEDNIMDVEAGADMRNVSIIAKDNNLSGMEVFYDIPSSLGGAVVMNAGSNGEEIQSILLKVRYFDLESMKIKEIDRDGIDFEYRNSVFQKSTDKIVLKGWLKLKPGNPESILKKMETIKASRWAKQPNEFPNAGSVFKRPAGRFVGQMIEELGLKGFNIGGARVSEKHAGFIINYHQATGQDIVTLINYVKDAVLDKFGVELEVEQKII
jgi:UDP-N-acetylmuramate dehydrogenase